MGVDGGGCRGDGERVGGLVWIRVGLWVMVRARSGWRSVTRAWWAAVRSASRTVRALSVVGKSFPVSSCLKWTPSSLKKRTVLSTPNRRRTLRMLLRDVPAYSCSVTLWWVTLHRPPPATRILAPSFLAPSMARTVERRPLAGCWLWIALPAAMAAMRPAAPAPRTAMSAVRNSGCWSVLDGVEGVGKLWGRPGCWSLGRRA